MHEKRVFTIFFCLALAIIFAGWLEAWPAATLMAAMCYGFYRWLWLEELLWFSAVFAVLSVALFATTFAPLGNLLVAFLAFLVGLAFAGWEAVIGVSVSWQAWRARRARRITQKQRQHRCDAK